MLVLNLSTHIHLKQFQLNCKMYRYVYLFVIVSAVIAESVSEQPHILLIVADDLGYNDVSWHNPDIQTPNMERLAR